jgi:hypothetical protein
MTKTPLFVVTLSLFWVGIPRSAVAAPAKAQAQNPTIDVKLDTPEGTKLTSLMPNLTLAVSPEAGVAVVVTEPSAPAAGARPMRHLMLADLKTGTLSPIAELLSKSQAGMAVQPQMSPDRKELLLTWLSRDGGAVYACGLLPGGKPIKVGSEVEGAWAGNRVALHGLTKEGKVTTITMVDPATGQSTELPVRGAVVAGLPDGSLLVGGNPKAPTAELSPQEAIETGRLFHVTADGKVLADLAPMGVVSSPPVLSRGGKYIAFQSKPADAPEGPKTKYSFTILSTDGKDKRELTTPYFPLTVTDDGAALVILNESGPDNMRDVSWITKDGKAVKQASKAVSAALIGKSVIYATNEPGPAIKTTPLAER